MTPEDRREREGARTYESAIAKYDFSLTKECWRHIEILPNLCWVRFLSDRFTASRSASKKGLVHENGEASTEDCRPPPRTHLRVPYYGFLLVGTGVTRARRSSLRSSEGAHRVDSRPPVVAKGSTNGSANAIGPPPSTPTAPTATIASIDLHEPHAPGLPSGVAPLPLAMRDPMTRAQEFRFTTRLLL